MPEGEIRESATTRESAPSYILRTTEQLTAYREWKQKVPRDIRALVEGAMQGLPPKIDKSHTPLISEFLHGFGALLSDSSQDIDTLIATPSVRRFLADLSRVSLPDGAMVNVFAALAHTGIDFAVKTNYVEAKVLPRLQWCIDEDARSLEHAPAPIGEMAPAPPQESYTPHRSPFEESEGEPVAPEALVYPYYGGYYRGTVYDVFDTGTLKWSQSQREMLPYPLLKLDAEKKRVYTSSIAGGQSRLLELPYGWGVDIGNVQWLSDTPPSGVSFAITERGETVMHAEGDGTHIFTLQIAPAEGFPAQKIPENEPSPVADIFPDDLTVYAREVMASRIPRTAKASRIVSHIRNYLEYDKSPEWEAIYKADPSAYFLKIWEHKKAKCDEANTLAARVLQSVGFQACFISGHSVCEKNDRGEAVLHEGNGHAWIEVFDPDDHTWVKIGAWPRKDATPKGDPNVDEEEQDEDLGEGDYGEQEAELMSEEELEKKMKEAKKREQASDPVANQCREAGLDPDNPEHRKKVERILEKINLLKNKYADVLKQARKLWESVVRKNLREHLTEKTPLRLSEADEIDEDELVPGMLAVSAGETDPEMGKREEIKKKREMLFGGYEVYIAADMSGSMNDTIDGVKKSEALRDMVFLCVQSCMSAAREARIKNRYIKSPMPVRVCVAAFGAEIKIVLPATDAWGIKEQIALYDALDSGAGGSTPDHQALALIESEIAQSATREQADIKKNPRLKKGGWKMRRFVLSVADGGSDDATAVALARERLEAAGVATNMFLIGREDDANLHTLARTAYGSFELVPRPFELAEKGLKKITERIRSAY
ncbi:MAG: transglutaminase domain-containing protein [Patescibacteria group bacterium]